MLIISTSVGLLALTFQHHRGDQWFRKITDADSPPTKEEAAGLKENLERYYGPEWETNLPHPFTTCQILQLPDEARPLWNELQVAAQAQQALQSSPNPAQEALNAAQAEVKRARNTLHEFLRELPLKSLGDIGRSDCSHLDNFSSAVGRKISLTKALIPLPKELRREIWAGYQSLTVKAFPRCGWSWSQEQYKAWKAQAAQTILNQFKQYRAEYVKSQQANPAPVATG